MLELVIARHNHLTRDLPDWMMRLWGLRLALLMALGCVAGSVSGVWPWVLMGFFVAGALAGGAFVRHKGILSTPNRKEPGAARYYRSDGEARLICYGDPVELERLKGLSDEFFEPVIVQYFPTGRNKVEWLMIASPKTSVPQWPFGRRA